MIILILGISTYLDTIHGVYSGITTYLVSYQPYS